MVCGLSTMAQWLNPCRASANVTYRHWFMSQLFHFPASSLLVAWESSPGWPKALGPCTHVGDQEEAPFSWFWISSVLAVVATCCVKQWR